MIPKNHLLAITTLLILTGTALAGPAEESQSPEAPDEEPSACDARRLVVARATGILAERILCLTPSEVETLGDLHDTQAWLDDVTPRDACTLLSWQHDSTTWAAAPCHDDPDYPHEDDASACGTLPLRADAAQDLCPQQSTARFNSKDHLDTGFVQEPGCEEAGTDWTVDLRYPRSGIPELFQLDACQDFEHHREVTKKTTRIITDCAFYGDCNAIYGLLTIPGTLSGILESCLQQTGVNQACGTPVPNPCPTPTGSAPGALLVLCGVPVPDPCPQGAGTSQACGVPLPDPDPYVGLVLDLLDFTVEVILGCLDGTLDAASTPTGSNDPLGCGSTVRLALDTIDLLVSLAWDGVELTVAVVEDCLTAFDANAPQSPHPTARQVGCGQLLRDLLDMNPCKDLLEPQEPPGDPEACGETIPLSTVQATANALYECLGLVGPYDGDALDVQGLQQTCDDARGPKEVPVLVPCHERDDDDDGVVAVDLCIQTYTYDPEEPDGVQAGDSEAVPAGWFGDPDDSDPSVPIPTIGQLHTEADPECGGSYMLGMTVVFAREQVLQPASGILPCPLPFTTPTYVHAASTTGNAPSDDDQDGIPGHLYLQQRQTTIHEDGTVTHQDQGPILLFIDPDDGNEHDPVPNLRLRIEPAEIDEDHDGIGDRFERDWEARIGEVPDWLQDLDDDGLGNVDEFRWDLVPICVPSQYENCMDWEQDRHTGSGGDNWLDGEEVAYWNDPQNDAHLASLSEDGLAVLDPDRHHDVDNDGLPDTRDDDSDDDTILDGDEVKMYGTYPEFADSDCVPEASACTLSWQSSGFYDESRLGSPGTGDGIQDDDEVAAWTDLGVAWNGDADGDGIPNLLDGDSDDDGLRDGPEFLEGRGQVFPDIEDSDNDAVLDGLEALWNVDSDGDGWINAGDPDSDDDGMPDGYEVAHGFDPLDSTDALRDADLDGLNNLGEYTYGLPASWDVRTQGLYWGGTDPLDPDTDDDELLDGAEVLEEETNPFWWDTDGDGLPDAWEAMYKTLGGSVAADPLVSDALVDGDGDSFDVAWCHDVRGRDYHNQHEYRHGMPGGWDSRPVSMGGDGVYWDGTHPNNPNTDGDLLPDGYEVCTQGTDPSQQDLMQNGDEDEDGLMTLDEVAHRTDFLDWDTDGDGLCDGGGAASCLSAESGSDGEVHGWSIVVAASMRVVTSDPLDGDTDGDLLGDLQERTLGTDPQDGDTDGDGLVDGLEDHDQDGVFEEGETDPLGPDSDGDGLTDGAEQWTYGTDALWADSDLDGVPDGDEVFIHGTDPAEQDTDGDFLTDGIELGIRDGGGNPAQVTDALDPDTDNDGILDGDEVYVYGLDPLVADEDCDGVLDGDDENPYMSNVPPGQVLSAEQRAACFGVVEDSSSQSLLPLGQPMGSMSASTPIAEDIGLIVFEEGGTISVLARPPASENQVTSIEALVRLEGDARTPSGLVATSGFVRAELQPVEEQDADDTAAQFTHGIRFALPEGMVEATAADYVLTILDENLNAAVYSGSASGFAMTEVEYQDDKNAADESVTDDDNSWDYVRNALTGGVDPDGEPASSSAGFPLGMSGEGDAPGTKAFRIVAGAPALVGEMVGGVLSVKVFDGSTGSRFVFYNDTAVEVDPSELELFMQAGCCGGFWKGLKRVGQGTTKALSNGFDFASDVGSVLNQAGGEVKTFTIGLYNDVKDPRTPEMFALRLVLDIAGVGDVIDLAEGVVNGDWLMVGLAVAGLALSLATIASFGAAAPLDLAVTSAKAGLRSARSAGLSGEALQQVGKFIGRAANSGVDAAQNAQKIERLSDVINTAGKHASKHGDSRMMRGLEALLKSDEAAEIAARSVKENRAMLRVFGDYATQHGDEAAQELFQTLKSSGNVDLDSVVKLWAKYDKHPQFRIDGVDLVDDLKVLAGTNIDGLDGLISSALKQAPKQGKGHYFTISQVAERVRDAAETGESVVDLGKGRDVILKLPGEAASKTHKLFPDAVFQQADGSIVYREYKNYADALPLRKFIKNQMHKYAKQIQDDVGDTVEFVVQNGAVRPSTLEEAAKACQRFGREAGCIKFVDRFGTPIG